ncbi:MAG: T9SS type A sorting domain-containing protein [Chitinophagales bacterium]
MKRLILTLLSLAPLFSNAQLFTWNKVADTINNTNAYYYYGYNLKNTITKKTTDNHIIYLKNINLSFNSLGQIKFDSIIISKYTLDGNRIWLKKYPLLSGGNINDFIETTDNGFLLVGEIGIYNSIVKLDEDGEFVFIRNYLNTDSLLTIKKIVATHDGNYLLTSYKEVVENGCYWFYEADIREQSFITKINPNGNILWHNFLSENKFRKGTYFYQNHFNISAIQFDFLEDTEQTFNVLSFTKENYNDPPLKLNLFHYDKNGNRLDSVVLKEYPVYNDWFVCTADYINDFINITNEGYTIAGQSYQDTIPIFKKYYFNKSGILVDSIIRNIRPYQFIGDNLFSYPSSIQTISAELNNNIFLLLSGSFVNSFTYIKCDSDFVAGFNESIELKDNSIFYGTCAFLSPIDDSTLLFISEVSKNSVTDTIMYLKFYHISLNSNRITYSIYIDKNNNGVRDATDTTFSNCLIEFNDGGSVENLQPNNGNYYGKEGTYTKYLLAGNYISKLISYEQTLKYYTVSPESKTSIFTSNSNGVDSIIFRLVPKPNIQDLQVSIIPTTGARPGFQSTYKILAKNVGTKTIENIEVKFLKDSLQTIESATILPTSVVDDTLIWNIDSMAIFELKEFTITCRNTIPPGLNANDTLLLFASITPFENDSSITDNSFLLKQVVVNSIDPNDKIESHGGGITTQQLTDGDYLYYTIRFQNTGTGYATKIKITDTLSDKLNWNTLDILANTNNLTYTIENKNIITWWNDNVYLPDSTSDEINSHGYVSFRIKPITNLQTSDIIENKAYIYFDYNAPVITNTSTTQIIEQRITNIKQNEIKEIKLYPSPTSNIVQLEFNAKKQQDITLKIVDVQGKEIYIESLKSNTGLNNIQLNLSDYANGIYLIQLNTGGNNLYYGKVLKQ